MFVLSCSLSGRVSALVGNTYSTVLQRVAILKILVTAAMRGCVFQSREIWAMSVHVHQVYTRTSPRPPAPPFPPVVAPLPWPLPPPPPPPPGAPPAPPAAP